jgi:hypothetical protein
VGFLEPEGFVEPPLAGFGVGEENLLPDRPVGLEDRGDQRATDSGPVQARFDEDVLQVADADPVRDHAGEADQPAVPAGGHHVGGPGHRGGQGPRVLEVGDPADRPVELPQLTRGQGGEPIEHDRRLHR